MQNYNSLVGLSPSLRALLADIGGGSLPPIRGKWHIVDPYKVTTADGGIDGSFASLDLAYDACVSGNGDGILVLSGGDSASETTSYLKQSLTWSKHGITVVGVSSGTQLYGRARVANVAVTTGALTTLSFDDTASVYTINDSASGFVTAGFVVGQKITVASTSTTNDGNYTITAVTAGSLTVTESVTDETAVTAGSTTITSYNPQMLVVSGDNNLFYNIHVGNFSSNVAALGCLKVTGNRNNFVGCHFIGAGHATPAAETGAYDLEVNAGQENTFVGSTFGTDTIIRAAANGNIRFDGDAWRTRFYDCEVYSQSETAGKGAILFADATALSGVHVFSRCRFINWNTNGIGTSTAAVIGTKPNSGNILFDSCSLLGWAAWGAAGMSGAFYVANSDATASGAGGIATSV